MGPQPKGKGEEEVGEKYILNILSSVLHDP